MLAGNLHSHSTWLADDREPSPRPLPSYTAAPLPPFAAAPGMGPGMPGMGPSIGPDMATLEAMKRAGLPPPQLPPSPPRASVSVDAYGFSAAPQQHPQQQQHSQQHPPQHSQREAQQQPQREARDGSWSREEEAPRREEAPPLSRQLAPQLAPRSDGGDGSGGYDDGDGRGGDGRGGG
eukprot:scaffold57053_cov33-Phaeocystis_antarctica.AAC.2